MHFSNVLLVVFCSTLFVVNGMKILSSASRQLNRRETNLVKRLVKRQALNGLFLLLLLRRRSELKL